MMNLKAVLCVGIFSCALFSNAQLENQNQLKDPLTSFKWFSNISMQIGASSTVDNFTYRNNTGQVIHYAKYWQYAPNLDANFQVGRVFSDKSNQVWSIQSGLSMMSNSVIMTDSLNENFQYQNFAIGIPLVFGMRLPFHSSLQNGNLYKCIDISVGLVLGAPLFYWIDNNYNPFNMDYLTLGGIGEFTFNALNKYGKGYKFGIRARMDLNSFNLSGGTHNYPVEYHSVGLVWYLSNNYK